MASVFPANEEETAAEKPASRIPATFAVIRCGGFGGGICWLTAAPAGLAGVAAAGSLAA